MNSLQFITFCCTLFINILERNAGCFNLENRSTFFYVSAERLFWFHIVYNVRRDGTIVVSDSDTNLTFRSTLFLPEDLLYTTTATIDSALSDARSVAPRFTRSERPTQPPGAQPQKPNNKQNLTGPVYIKHRRKRHHNRMRPKWLRDINFAFK